MTWLGLIFIPLMVVLFLLTPGTIQFFGRAVGQSPPGLGFVLSLGLFALVYWQYKILTGAETRAVFEEEEMEGSNR